MPAGDEKKRKYAQDEEEEDAISTARTRQAEQRIYRDLADNEFRVLRLFSGEYDDELHGQLEYVKHAIHEDYTGVRFYHSDFETISYAWESSEKPCKLITKAGVIPITVSVVLALRRYRYIRGHRKLWADAVCINQADLWEKNAQVAKMWEIYRSSQRVLVWLGPSRALAKESHAVAIMSACYRFAAWKD